MIYSIIESFSKLGLPKIKNDDFFDRLSRKYSIVLIGISFIIVTTTQFVGHPIHCYTQMVDSQHKIDYVNWVCWISSSYYLPFEKPLPNRNQKPPERIPYYQWVPFILCTMMILFYIPGFLWRKLNRNCGIDTKSITAMINNMDQLNSEKRKDPMSELVKHIDTALLYHRGYRYGFMYRTWKRFSDIICFTCGQHSGNYLAATYVIVKVLYTINAFGQFFLLNVFMGDRFHLYGFETLKKWFYGEEIIAVERFPRITMCRYTIRTLGDNVQSYDVQCLLPNNIYNEKIFLIIWFWLAFVSFASLFGLIRFFHYFTLKSRKSFIRRFLKANNIDYYTINGVHFDKDMLGTFVDKYCRQDGLLLLRIIDSNMNNVIVGELICALWNNWQLQRETRIETVSQRTNHKKSKLFDDNDSNLSTSVPSRAPTIVNHDERYILLSPSI